MESFSLTPTDYVDLNACSGEVRNYEKELLNTITEIYMRAIGIMTTTKIVGK